MSSLSLVDLIGCIVDSGNRAALFEFHDHRTAFRFNGSGPIRLAEFVGCLRGQESVHGNGAAAGHAYDLTIAKFSHLPTPDGSDHRATDCRKYFRPFVRQMLADRNAGIWSSDIQEEQAAASRLQQFVVRHFHLSLLEALRHELPGMSRYEWKTPSGTISVQMPKAFEGRHRREWLTANILDADAGRPGENQRVQDIINRRFGLQVESIDGNPMLSASLHSPDHNVPAIGSWQTAEDIIDALAEEKVEKKCQLSNGFRCMSDEALRDVIHTICDNLMVDRRSDATRARPFWMNKVEFSRFAGTRWAARKTVPTLWANLAHVLACRDDFVEAAREAHVWERLQDMTATRKASADKDRT